ncbi:MAG TPA: AMP-binding protein [Solirubrobacteraceae bacterium]|jgi:O-succinylbenzoic acid--CoA ligase|nr:AMP-binding protein [Solirubrobacteraceae bacterium]
MLVDGWLARAAAARPAHPALIGRDGSVSYEQLLAAARCGADQLSRLGVGPGDRVGIALEGGFAFAQALHACLLLGAVAVPIDTRLREREREAVAAGSAVVLGEPLAVPGGGPAREREAAVHDLDAPAVVVHTSGTSAEPRPVTLTYANILWSALGSAAALDARPQDRWLCTLPVSHVGGLSILLRSAIYATTALVHPRFDTDRVLRAMEREEVTLVSLVATTLARLLDAGLHAPPALRCALIGGGPVPAALVARARGAGVAVALTYGLTEACSQVTTTPAAELSLAQPPPGPPLFCVRVAIAPGGDGASGVGEILVAGPTVAPGSLGSDGWLHTGDLGRIDSYGRLHVSGRLGDTIITGGENVAPAEVESALEAHPGVLEAAVIGRAHPGWGQAVTAIIVPRPGWRIDGEQLREHCRQALAPFKVPREIELRERPLPRTRSGKLQRGKLR